MTTELKPLFDLLAAHYGWLTTLVGWVGALRLAFGWFSKGIQDRLTQRMADAAASQDPDDDRDWEAILRAHWYRVASLLLYVIASIRLPVLNDFLKLKANTPAK